MKNSNNQKGVALVTVLYFLVIITVLATGTIMVATTQVKVAGSMAKWESTFNAAEAGIDYTMNLTKWAYYEHTIPSYYSDQINDSSLIEELTEPKAYDTDTVSGPTGTTGPDISFQDNGYQVNVDVDATGITHFVGTDPPQQEFAWGYTAVGRAGKAGTYVGFKIHSVATPVNSSSQSTKSEIIQIIGVPQR